MNTLVDTADIARMFEVTTERVRQIAATDSRFPVSVGVVGHNQRIWLDSEVLAYAGLTGRTVKAVA